MNTRISFRRGSSLALGLLLSGLAITSFAFTGENLSAHAKIDEAQARSIALKAHPGTLTAEELEREPGGSGLRYSFDIRNGKHVQEVGVDAVSGKLLENKLEGPHPD